MVRSVRQLMKFWEVFVVYIVYIEHIYVVLYTSQHFHIVGNHTMGYAEDTTIYAVIPRPLSRP